ncbi:MAG: UDP-3-O-(3-hydroxymyristoyl)glucosamine N-acyltransferase [Oligoflexia bacterium]|nr:UDP-3-O-(3-hydroxymyristoyl)glucosamine N-acyltransferase [Oligoflexia bacterium]
MSQATSNKRLTLGEIASLSKGVLQGSADLAISGLCPLDEGCPGCISFIRENSPAKVLSLLQSTQASAAFVVDSLRSRLKEAPKPLIFVPNPQAALFDLIPHFFVMTATQSGISERADIHPSAKLGKGVNVGAFVSIGADVSIGDGSTVHPHVCLYQRVTVGRNCVIHSGAVLREDCAIGDNCTIQPGAVIGADGFGYIPDPKLGLKPIPQVGQVVIDKGVDIGANSCIDRAALGATRIGQATKIDNLVQVGHNTKIGKAVIICGQVGIAGSCNIADQVVLGGGTGVADHVSIGVGVRAAGRSGITSDISEPGDYMGFPALPARTWRRIYASLPRLPKIVRSLKGASKSNEEE